MKTGAAALTLPTPANPAAKTGGGKGTGAAGFLAALLQQPGGKDAAASPKGAAATADAAPAARTAHRPSIDTAKEDGATVDAGDGDGDADETLAALTVHAPVHDTAKTAAAPLAPDALVPRVAVGENPLAPLVSEPSSSETASTEPPAAALALKDRPRTHETPANARNARPDAAPATAPASPAPETATAIAEKIVDAKGAEIAAEPARAGEAPVVAAATPKPATPDAPVRPAPPVATGFATASAAPEAGAAGPTLPRAARAESKNMVNKNG